ncbi:hypothetical protein K439DRAFT_1617328 [Ramaria rubella]|nr:hypothetical protein K439DRAFT_1617328 [Ramaria rubella]
MLALAPSLDDNDMYKDTCQHLLVYQSDKDTSIQEETLIHEQEVIADTTQAGTADILEDSSEESEGEMDSSDPDDNFLSDAKKLKSKKVLSVPDKLHAVIIDIVQSEVQCKHMCWLICQVCEEEYKHLILIWGMPIFWNTLYAEIECAIKLKPVVFFCPSSLDDLLTHGQKKHAASHKKKNWFLTPEYWDMLSKLCYILWLFNQATLELSKANAPTICKVLPLYKLVQEHLQCALHDTQLEYNPYGLDSAIQAGLDKVEKYLHHAIRSDYILLGAVLHPSIWITYFEDDTWWAPAIPKHAHMLIDHLYNLYSEQGSHSGHSIFMQAIHGAQSHIQTNSTNDVESYFSGAYPCVWTKMSSNGTG